MKSVPMRCEQCVEEGSYYGVLQFPNMEKVPMCKTHKVQLTEAPRRKPRYIDQLDRRPRPP